MSDSRPTTTCSSVRLPAVLAFVVVAVSVVGIRAQGPGGGAPSSGDVAPLRPSVAEMRPGQPFLGSLRDLPQTAPPMPERRLRHERDELPDPPSGLRADAKDPVVQGPNAPAPSAPAPSTTVNFAGLDFAAFGAGWPPDTNGAAGPTHYIQTVNTAFGVFNKSTGARVVALTLDALFATANTQTPCDNSHQGDPVVLYDGSADRFIVTDFAWADGKFSTGPFYQCFAVSKTGDPVNGGWNFYAIVADPGAKLHDYEKLAVWPDGIYMTANMFATTGSQAFQNVRVWAFDKAKMYAGQPASVVVFNLPSKIQGVAVFSALPSNYHPITGAPPAGRENLIASIWGAYRTRVWKFKVNWTTPANSSLSGPGNITIPTFSTPPSSIPARNGNNLDSLGYRVMMQNQYTNIGGVESLWITHSVGNGSGIASVRWYQFRVTGGTIQTSGPIQSGTWNPNATHRWMPSLAVNKKGDMAVGYSASSSSMFPAIRYAGRLAGDAPGTLSLSETSMVEGSASQCCTFSDGSTNNRWGDYSAMTIDPDGCTFWYTTEYYETPQPTTLGTDNWKTRIGSFKFAGCQ
jgi:hypothetical protein